MTHDDSTWFPEGPPYPGQGSRLPDNFGPGAWVIENSLLLSLDNPEASNSATLMTPALPNGLVPYSFPASMVATQLKVSVDQLMAANRDGQLGVKFQVDPAAPSLAIWIFHLNGIGHAFTYKFHTQDFGRA